jgi:predicted amidohydrolase
LSTLRIGLAHLAPAVGQLGGDRAAMIDAFHTAADHGCDWVVAGELVSTGYDFVSVIGTDWISSPTDGWLAGYSDVARDRGMSIFVHLPDRDPTTSMLHSTMFAVGSDGAIRGSRRRRAIPR